MSLVGSLEDLGLADILQIVSLAQKSGRLLLRSGGDTGRILLRAGLVCGGAIKGERDTLRALLLEGEHLPPEQFEEASRLSEDEGLSLVSAVARVTAMEVEAIESLRRKHTERSVMRMFGWMTGEFSFDVRDDIDAEDRELQLTSGINTQYLAMEASRLRDEGVDLEARDDRDETGSDLEPQQGPASDSPIDALALASAHAADAESPLSEASESDSDGEEGEELRFAGEDALAEAPESIEITPNEEPAPGTDAEASLACASEDASEIDGSLGPPPVMETAPPELATAEVEPPLVVEPKRLGTGAPVVVMDPDLSGLEWIKAALADGGRRVHIFQQAEPAMLRVRQYLVRGERPLVLVSPRIDGTFEAPDVTTLVARLRGLAPGLPVLELICEGREVPGDVKGVTATVRRPMAPGHDPEGWFLYRPLAEALRTDLDRASHDSSVPVRRSDIEVLQQLKVLSQRLRNPQQEDVLSLVLDFAAETFERVAVFMLRDDQALGMVGRRLPAGSSALSQICWEPRQLPELLRSALEEKAGIHGNLADPGNEGLFALLGEAAAPAYAAPIESGGCVAALLYADSGAGRALADTTALEIVLHEAGLALDRALLERTLKG